ncbi:hypothetical protein N0V92_003481 [Colletotrichum tropicale]|nr:hypothetical protein N0V92_003481 [Colletotrichum tropicale]
MSEKIYREVPHEEEEVESLAGSLNTENTENTDRPASTSRWRRMRVGDEMPCKEKARLLLARYWPWAVHGLLLTTSITFFALAFCLRFGNKIDDQYFVKKYSSYSPAAEVVKYHSERWKLLPIMDFSPFVGAGWEVDRAWDHITNNVGDQMISHAELVKLGLDPKSIKITNPITGEEGYRAGLEVFHQLHCLNLLRQSSYPEYYNRTEVGGDVPTDAEDLRGHIDHCIEAIRMKLMCESDIGVFTFKMYPELPVEGHWPDFSTLHTCRNFDDIRNWAMIHSVTFEDEE